MLLLASPAAADDLDTLSRDFWVWRTATQPFSGDDIPRLARPAGWREDWSPAAFAAQQKSLAEFEARWQKLSASAAPIPRQVDYRLVGSAIARARWELIVLRSWRRDPFFYIHQTMGSVFALLLQPPPFTAERSAEIVRRLGAIPPTLTHARTNLDEMRGPFAQLAIDELKDIRERMQIVARSLKPLLAAESATKLDGATEKSIVALENYRDWLREKLPALPADTSIGRANYVWFLKNVALLPFTPEQMLSMGRQEWDRALSFEAYEHNRNAGVPPLALPATQAEQIAQMNRALDAARKFSEEKNILSVPAWTRRYPQRPLPDYIAALHSLGVANDLTGPDRLAEDGTSWIPAPSPANGYFERIYATDPRTQIAHESYGHYLQLILSWAHEDPIRRHYYDSGANEGLAFYNEEMLLQAGFFDDSPHSREMIYSMMRLRALRVEVDVKLATGIFTIAQGADYLRTAVPMDAQTASAESAFFASLPGQAITYQIGKLQILSLLADARRAQGEKFSLRAFHDFVWKNGNVPLALLRWELLADRSALTAVDALK
jgi:uncharacterized protein (DUF885 family)